MPTFSSGAAVKNDLRSFEAAQPRVVHEAVDPQTEPPLHGTNPHGQGTAAVVDLTPNETRPFTVDEAGTAEDEDVVIGRSRGEQRADGTYHGHITVAALFGNEIIEAADTGPGESDSGSLLEAVTTPLCASTGICLGVVEFSSTTTNTGSSNSFRTASVALADALPLPGGLPPLVPPALSVGAASSFGNIGSSGACQTAVGGSQVADVAAATAPVVDVAESRSESVACTGGTSSQTNSSRVVELAGDPLPLPLLPAGCANGTPDTTTGIPGVLEIVCNADDRSATGGTQAANSAHVYGVRNALDVWVLSAVQVSAAQSESLAVAPAAVTTPTTTTPTTTTPTTTPTTTTPTTTTPTATTPTPGSGPGTTDDDGTAGEGGAGGDDGAGNEGAGDDGAGDGTPECSDGVDNDGDGEIDFGSDPDCTSAEDDSEAGNAVSLGGNELPFTGTDVVVLGLAGSLLLAAGLTLRGPARRREFDL